MSLFPTEHLSIGLTPSAIGIAVYRGRWRPSRVDLFDIPVEAPGLDGMLAALALGLQDKAKPGSTVRFSVSNIFCRVALQPWGGESLTAMERQILAHRQFSELYGDMSGWEIRGEREPAYGQSSLAVAMPEQLLSPVRDMVKASRLQCRSISAHAVDSWNRHGKHVPIEGLFSVIESGSAFFMALRGEGRISEISAARLVAFDSEDTAMAIESLVGRELLLQGVAHDGAVLCDTLGASMHGGRGKYSLLPYAADISTPAMAMAVNGMAV